MSTTDIFVELLIVGLQASIWIILFVLSIFGFDWVDLSQIKGADLIFVFLVTLPVAYPLGVMLDNLVDRLLTPIEKKISARITGTEREKYTVIGLFFKTDREELFQYLEYVRRRIRICRSSILNFFLITVAAVVFTLTVVDDFKFPVGTVIALEIIFGLLATFLALYSWIDLSSRFRKRIVQAHEQADRKNKSASS